MCGIIGYVGNQNAVPIIIEGLKKLEYRGYDSAGIAVYDSNKFDVVKQKGRLAALEDKLKKHPVSIHGMDAVLWTAAYGPGAGARSSSVNVSIMEALFPAYATADSPTHMSPAATISVPKRLLPVICAPGSPDAQSGCIGHVCHAA